MKKTNIILIVLIFIILNISINFAFAEDLNETDYQLDNSNTIYVNASYMGRFQDGTQDHPYSSIYNGFSSLAYQHKSNIYLANGEYTVNRAMSFSNYSLNVIGESTNVIINAQENPGVFQFSIGNYTLSNIKFINSVSTSTQSNNDGYKAVISINATGNGGYNMRGTNTSLDFFSLILRNCIFEDNTGKTGGAVYAENGYIRIYNSNFTSNKGGNGGALTLNNTKLLLDNCNFKNNVGDNGGSIYLINTIASITNSNFINNTGKYGGAIFSEESILNMLNSKFTGNMVNGSTANAGAVYLYDTLTNINNSIFNYNKVYGKLVSAGAIFSTSSLGLIINNSLIVNNSVNGEYVFGSAINNIGLLTLINTTITNNNANGTKNTGEAIYNPNGLITSTDSVITNNTSKLVNSRNNVYLIFDPFVIGKLYNENINLPSKYDLRNITLENGSTISGVTSVKNQGNYGTCWAFSSLGALESYLKLTEGVDYDFSVANLIKSMGNTSNTGYDLNTWDGGNFYLSTAYLTRWDGPVNTSDDPYNYYSIINTSDLSEIKHVQDIIFIPIRENLTDLNDIKTVLLKYGAVAVMYYNSEYETTLIRYNSSYSSIYEPIPEIANHGVLLVGWDDNYPASNFQSIYGQPEGDGAFIIKNSWGTRKGEEGYYYVSYYDKTFGGLCGYGITGMAFTNVENTNNYKDIYQYDQLGDTLTFIGFNNDTAWFSNQYTSQSDDPLAAFSIITSTPNSIYNTTIALNNKTVYNTIGTINESGFHTIKLNQYIPLKFGDEFKITVKLTTPGFYYPIAIETQLSDLTKKAEAQANQSFISSDGEEWYDISKDTTVIVNSKAEYYTQTLKQTNVCLKACIGFANTTILTCDNFTTIYGDIKNLTGKLTDNTTNPLAGQHISLNLTRISSGANKVYDVVTDYTGVYRLEINLAPGKYTAKPIFNGNNNLKYSAAPLTSIKVKTDNRTDTIIQLNNYTETIHYGETKNIKGKLILEDNTPLTGENIEIKLTRTSTTLSKIYTLITDNIGEFNLPISLSKGEYLITCTYKGTDIYDTYTINKKLTII